MRVKYKRTSLSLIALCLLFLYIRQTNYLSLKSISQKNGYTPNEISSEFENLDLRIDWHDYEVIHEDRKRKGPGEHGSPVVLNKAETEHDAYKDNGFNILVSDRISLNRSLPDIRVKQCKNRKYLEKLSTVSVIIPFHNEGFTTLLRSIHSIINRTPKKLLHEIILVDDFSTMHHLGELLTNKLKSYPVVKLIRLKKREGLIRARLSGIEQARGKMIVILDSHIEVTNNWLPPLIEPIEINRKTITCPMIDVINNDNFEYRSQNGDAMRGAFSWELLYKRIPIPPKLRKSDPSVPFEDPVMAGGLFAADRSYFNEIGGYDPGLEIWGGEQYELSFKTWMCGGKILDCPCSRVGHIYRKFVPYKSMGKGWTSNYKRVAEVWMDEYKEHVYKRLPSLRTLKVGDVSKQLELRNDLKCKSFDWFLNEVAPDILKHYPVELPKSAAWGTLINKASGYFLIFFITLLFISLFNTLLLKLRLLYFIHPNFISIYFKSNNLQFLYNCNNKGR